MSGVPHSAPARRRLRAVAIACALATVGCDWGGWTLRDQPVYRPYEPSELFPDRSSIRPRPPGTVPRTPTPQADTGRLPELGPEGRVGSPTDEARELAELERLTPELLRLGQQRYGIFCTPCHGRAGYGDGMVAQRGFPPPPSFHTERLRQAPDGYLLGVIREGLGKMPSYRYPVPPADRAAIVAYIRALQLSQHARMEDVPPIQRHRLEMLRARPELRIERQEHEVEVTPPPPHPRAVGLGGDEAVEGWGGAPHVPGAELPPGAPPQDVPIEDDVPGPEEE